MGTPVLYLDMLRNAVRSLEDSQNVVATEWFDRQPEKIQNTLTAGIIQNFEVLYETIMKMIKRQIKLEAANPAEVDDDFSDSDLPWKVDVLDWATTSVAFRKIVERDRIVLQRATSRPEHLAQGGGTRPDALGAENGVHRDEPDFDTSNEAT